MAEHTFDDVARREMADELRAFLVAGNDPRPVFTLNCEFFDSESLQRGKNHFERMQGETIIQWEQRMRMSREQRLRIGRERGIPSYPDTWTDDEWERWLAFVCKDWWKLVEEKFQKTIDEAFELKTGELEGSSMEAGSLAIEKVIEEFATPDLIEEPAGSHTPEHRREIAAEKAKAEEEEDHHDGDFSGVSHGLRIEVARDESGYYWAYYAKNGRIIATGPSAHPRLNDLKIAINGMRKEFAEAPLVRIY